MPSKNLKFKMHIIHHMHFSFFDFILHKLRIYLRKLEFLR